MQTPVPGTPIRYLHAVGFFLALESRQTVISTTYQVYVLAVKDYWKGWVIEEIPVREGDLPFTVVSGGAV